MTVIVAVHDPAGRWAIGSDSTLWDGPVRMQPTGRPKLFRRPDGVVLVSYGRSALGPLLDGLLDEDDGGERTDRWAQRLADRWSAVARERHHVYPDGDVAGGVIIAVGDACWLITDGFAARLTSWHTAGAGREVAAGAVHVLSRTPMPADEIARRAVEAAIAVHEDCAGQALIEFS